MSRQMRVTCDFCGMTESYNPSIAHTSMFNVWQGDENTDLDICQECINKLKIKASEPKDDPDELIPIIEEKYRKFEIYHGDSESVFSDIASTYESNPKISYLDMLIQTGLVHDDWHFPKEWSFIGWKKMPVCKFMDDPRTNKTFIIISEPNKLVK